MFLFSDAALPRMYFMDFYSIWFNRTKNIFAIYTPIIADYSANPIRDWGEWIPPQCAAKQGEHRPFILLHW
jgi:hypothetical protein